MMTEYIVINMDRIIRNKLVFWMPSALGYTENLGKAGTFYNLSRLGLKRGDIAIQISDNINEIGLTSKDFELANKISKNNVIEITIDLDMDFRGKRIIEILSEIQQ